VGRSEPRAHLEAVLEGAGDAVGEDGGEADPVIYHSANLPQPSDFEESDFEFRISNFEFSHTLPFAKQGFPGGGGCNSAPVLSGSFGRSGRGR
jgi:hypothetical protein